MNEIILNTQEYTDIIFKAIKDIDYGGTGHPIEIEEDIADQFSLRQIKFTNFENPGILQIFDLIDDTTL